MEKNGLKALKAVVFGATGATGREVVAELLKSPKWEQVSVIVRRKLDQWEALPEEQKRKLNIIMCENLDQLSDGSKWKFPDYQCAFCCLGSRATNYGKDMFYKVDHDYTIESAKIARANQIPHYSIVSSSGANPKSMFFYFKVKGQTDNEIISMNFPSLSIFRPGALEERDNDKIFLEKLFSFIPFLPRITTKTLAKALRIDAELRLQKSDESVDKKLKLKKEGNDSAAHYIYGNTDAKNLANLEL